MRCVCVSVYIYGTGLACKEAPAERRSEWNFLSAGLSLVVKSAWIYFMFRRRKRLSGGQSSRSAVIGERLIGHRPQIIFPRSTKSGFWRACLHLHRQNKWAWNIFTEYNIRCLNFVSSIYSAAEIQQSCIIFCFPSITVIQSDNFPN